MYLTLLKCTLKNDSDGKFYIIYYSTLVLEISIPNLTMMVSAPPNSELMDSSPPGCSVHGISRQVYWSGLPFPPTGDLPIPGIKLAPPALAGRFFTTAPAGKSLKWYVTI